MTTPTAYPLLAALFEGFGLLLSYRSETLSAWEDAERRYTRAAAASAGSPYYDPESVGALENLRVCERADDVAASRVTSAAALLRDAFRALPLTVGQEMENRLHQLAASDRPYTAALEMAEELRSRT